MNPNGKSGKNKLKNLLAVLVSVLICMILIEVLFRWIGFPPGQVSGWKSRTDPKELNQLGFRGQQINYSDSDYVILLLGDSQAEAGICSLDNMPEKRLQHYLKQLPGLPKNIKVFTVATGGYGQDQEFLMLKEYYKRYRADMVLLWFTPQNDVRDNIFPSHWPTNGAPKPTYWIKDNKLYGPNDTFGATIHEGKIKLYDLINRVLIKNGLRKKPKSLRRDEIWDTILPKPYQPLTDYTGPVKNDWQEAWDKNVNVDGYVKDDNLENDKNRFNEYLTPLSERMAYGRDLTKRLLDSIRITVEKHSGKFMLFYTLIPAEKNDAFLQDGVYTLNGKKYRITNEQYKDNLDFITNGFSSIPITVTVQNWRVDYNNAHLNPKTNDIVMKDLSEILKPMLLSKDSSLISKDTLN
jgi:hypothetical protein